MTQGLSWKERSYDAALAASFQALGVAKPLCRVLAARGISPDALDEFRAPSLKHLMPPESIPGVTQAVSIILPYLERHAKIVVFGDYDADGVCATAILVKALSKLGGNAVPFLPHRFNEGYGITPLAIERLFAEHPDVALIITVDNGITAAAEVRELRARGIGVVVTDHHLPGESVPEADALVDPKLSADVSPAIRDLCGAGIAFFLSTALAKAATERGLYTGGKFAGPLLVMAGLATYADIVPLVGQNRILVAQAVANFKSCAPLGLKELCARANRSVTNVTASDFGFLFAPRINAAGRMASALEAYALLTTEDAEEARQLALQIDMRNIERKAEENRVHLAAIESIASQDCQHAIVAAGRGWHQGVAGIVASRIMNEYHIPVAVVTEEHGSARAPAGYNVRDALASAAAALLRFGGHAGAGGFSVREGALDEFRRLFTAACINQCETSPEAGFQFFDGWVAPKDLTLPLGKMLESFAPFGDSNEEPIFGLKGVSFKELRTMGFDGKHATIAFSDDSIPRAVWWRGGSHVDELRAIPNGSFDVFFSVFLTDFGAEEVHLELKILDVCATSQV